MDVNDIKSLNAEVKKRMDSQIEFVRKELAGVRTGRASTDMLAGVVVEAYGSKLPINQVASLSIPEPALISNGDNFFVFVVDGENKAQMRPVQIGIRLAGKADMGQVSAAVKAALQGR